MNKSFDLTTIPMYAERIVPADVVASPPDQKVLITKVVEGLRIRINQDIWSQELGETSVSYPRNWLEALKERWLPVRWRRHWPVEYTVREFKMVAMFPYYHPPVELGKHRLAIERMPDKYISY